MVRHHQPRAFPQPLGSGLGQRKEPEAGSQPNEELERAVDDPLGREVGRFARPARLRRQRNDDAREHDRAGAEGREQKRRPEPAEDMLEPRGDANTPRPR